MSNSQKAPSVLGSHFTLSSRASYAASVPIITSQNLLAPLEQQTKSAVFRDISPPAAQRRERSVRHRITEKCTYIKAYIS